MYVSSWFQDCHHQKGGDYGSNDFKDYFDDFKESRVNQVPKNQASRIKSQRIKIQEQLSFKIQEQSRLRFKTQDSSFKKSWFQDSREEIEKQQSRLHKGSIFSKNPNIAQFCFTKEFSQIFLSYQSIYSLVIDYQFPVIDYQWQSLIAKAFNWICNVPIVF